MRTLRCPLCKSRWKVETNGDGTDETIWITCVPCEETLPQQIFDQDGEDDEGTAPPA